MTSERAVEECPVCHGSDYIDNGCGIVLCPECGVSASSYRLAATPAPRENGWEERLAEALHDAMCPTSHHDRPPARCSDWAKYPLIAASVVQRLAGPHRTRRVVDTRTGTTWDEPS